MPSANALGFATLCADALRRTLLVRNMDASQIFRLCFKLSEFLQDILARIFRGGKMRGLEGVLREFLCVEQKLVSKPKACGGKG